MARFDGELCKSEVAGKKTFERANKRFSGQINVLAGKYKRFAGKYKNPAAHKRAQNGSWGGAIHENIIRQA